MKNDYTIALVTESLLPDALALVWNVFAEFEAPEYAEEGVEEFRRFIEPETIKEKLGSGSLTMWVCLNGNAVIGVIAMRPPCHISLLFVDKSYHHQGIARALFEHLLYNIRQNTRHTEITVNSSPYAAGFYRRMGFADMDKERTVNGIRFIPMKRNVYESAF